MKKSLVAIAAFAAIGFASAQSAVTLSGTVDVALAKAKNAAAGLESGVVAPSQFTIAGYEDLGGGLKAVFHISNAFDSTFRTKGNTSDTTLGNNGVHIGLTGDFGQIYLGRPQSLMMDMAQTATFPLYVGLIRGDSTIRVNRFVDNGVQFVSKSYGAINNYGGFSFAAEYAPSEVQGLKSMYSLGAKYDGKYADQSFGISAAMSKTIASAITPKENEQDTFLLGGYWDFGPAKLSYTFQKDKGQAVQRLLSVTKGAKYDAHLIGVSVPVMTNGLLVGDVGIQRFNGFASTANADGKISSGKLFRLTYKHALSKRTAAYAGFAQAGKDYIQQDYNSAMIPSVSSRATQRTYGVGVVHSF